MTQNQRDPIPDPTQWMEIGYQDRIYRLAIHDRGDQISKTLAQGKFYEIDLLEAIAQIQRRGIYVDVGTHIGNHALFFATECPSTLVIGFEPWSASCVLAKQTMKANKMTHKVKIFNKPVSDVEGALVTYTPPKIGRNTGSGTTCTGGDLRAVSVDGTLSKLGAHQPVALIKIDVEGFELEVLKGAAETIERWRPIIGVETKTQTAYARIDSFLTTLFHYERAGRYCATPTWLYMP
jgi:FkbM family methyltransferase